MNHFIGGDLSQYERQPYIDRMREKGKTIILPGFTEAWKLQCRCGNCAKLSYYRGRMYCYRCGRTLNKKSLITTRNIFLANLISYYHKKLGI